MLRIHFGVIFLFLFFQYSISSNSRRDALLAYIQEKETQVKNICEEVTLFYSLEEAVVNCEPLDCCDSPAGLEASYEFVCGDYAGRADDYCGCNKNVTSISRDNVCPSYSEETDEEDEDVKSFICFTESLIDVYKEHYRQDPGIVYQYIGSPTSAYSEWPALPEVFDIMETDESCMEDIDDCGDWYDCRTRPWYIAGSSGPKDIVMVLDISGSMSNTDSDGVHRVTLMKEAAISVIEGMGVLDRLYIVFFNDGVSSCGSYFSGSNEMQYTTEANRELFIECVDDVSVSGKTNFEIALEKAFSVLATREVASVTCHTAVLFLTDGEVTVGQKGTPLLDKVRDWNSDDINAKMFTFSLSNDADDLIPKRLACDHDGVWIPIRDGENLRNKMDKYYLYFSFSDPKRWSEAYEDWTGMLGDIVSCVMGCFSSDGMTLVGVAGVDTMVSTFEDMGYDYATEVAPELFDRSNVCYDNLDLDPDVLASLREHHTCSFASYTGVWVAFIVVGGGIACVVFVCVVLAIFYALVNN